MLQCSLEGIRLSNHQREEPKDAVKNHQRVFGFWSAQAQAASGLAGRGLQQAQSVTKAQRHNGAASHSLKLLYNVVHRLKGRFSNRMETQQPDIAGGRNDALRASKAERILKDIFEGRSVFSKDDRECILSKESVIEVLVSLEPSIFKKRTYSLDGVIRHRYPLSLLSSIGARHTLLDTVITASPPEALSEAWFMACGFSTLDTVMFLYKKDIFGAIEYVDNYAGDTPLIHACENDDVKVAEYVYARDTSAITDVNRKKETPLHVACNRGSLSVVVFLLQKNDLQLEELDANGYTPFNVSLCREDDSLKVTKYLVENIDPKLVQEVVQGGNGGWPLHHACWYSSNPAVIEYLIGLCPQACKVTDKKGRLPLEIISKNMRLSQDDRKQLMKLLISTHPQALLETDEWGKRLLSAELACDLLHQYVMEFGVRTTDPTENLSGREPPSKKARQMNGLYT